MRFGNALLIDTQTMQKPETPTQLMSNLTSCYVVSRAGEAVFLLNRLIFECFDNKSEFVEIVLKDLAQEYGVSKQTMSLWCRRLIKEGLISKEKVDNITKFKLVSYLNPFLIIKERILTEVSSSHFILQDIIQRLEKLESPKRYYANN
jgi:DNA-binding MarR family transcriptional regulator